MRFRRRLLLLYIAFCVALGIIWLRSSQLQLIDGDAWAQEARRMRQHEEPLEARRGPMISADGVVLAEDAHVFQLTVVPWEFQRRGRARCPDCAAMYYQRGSRLARLYIPSTCACARHARRGATGPLRPDAYPRADLPADGIGRLKRLPNGDLRSLEKALELEAGALTRAAEDRIAEIDRLVKLTKARWERDGDTSVFMSKRLEMRRQDLLMRPFVVVGRVAPEVARLVLTDEDGRYRGFRIQDALRRHYPQGDFAPHLLGWTSQLTSREEYMALRKEHGPKRITLSTRWGRRGLEAEYNLQLLGVPGRATRELDKQGQFTKVLEDLAPRPGRTLHLSVDVAVSRAAERVLAQAGAANNGYFPKGRPSAAFLMIDAHSGEILVWAETPSFDLNTELGTLYTPDGMRPVTERDGPRLWNPAGPFDARLDLEAWRAAVVAPVPVTMSRIGQVAVEPGSTMKPLIGLAMLSSGRPLPFTQFTCAGGRSPGCHHCGTIGLEMAICRSCNRYFAFSLRDSQYWPVYRTKVAAFVHEMGLGQKPTGECDEWVAGQWLWPWQDYEIADATKMAEALLAKERPGRAPTLQFVPRARTRTRIGGNPERLAAKLAALGGWVSEHSRSRALEVSVSQVAREGSRVTLRFGVRAAGQPAWFALPSLTGESELPASIAALPQDRRGVQGLIERGGTAWFTVTVPRHVGRSDPDAPPVIAPDDGRNVAIGQGPVLVTPLHMTRVMALIANGGTLVEPHAVRAIGTRRTTFVRPQIALDRRHLDRIRDGMWQVVNTPAGTADKAPWHTLPVEVSGKTGTAQVGATWQPWTVDVIDEEGPWHHWFVGYAAGAGRRTVAFACVLHARTEAASGYTAAPATQKILEQWYKSPRSFAAPISAGTRGR